MQNRIIDINSSLGRAMTAVAVLLILAGHFLFAKWGLANMASTQTDKPEIAAITAELAPADPQTHYAAAVLYEKTFLPEDQARSLAEFERAAAASPNNYLLWLSLGTARSRSGDLDGAEAALERAQQLAPNYASVQWAIGNLMVRRGRAEEGFAEIQKAVAGSKTYAGPAVVLAAQLFGDDVDRLRRLADGSPEMQAALALSLAQQKRFDQAVTVWNSLQPDQQQASAEPGRSLFNALLAEHRYRDAKTILASLDGSTPASPGQLTNGGFEAPITLRASSPFDWQITGTGEPQVVPTSGERHGGSQSVALVFRMTESREFQPVSQTVPVDPGTAYVFRAFYKSDLDTRGPIRWEIVDAASGKVLASTPDTAKTTEWKELSAQFTPDGSDAVIIRLVRSGCSSPLCPASGRIWFDDLSISRQ